MRILVRIIFIFWIPILICAVDSVRNPVTLILKVCGGVH